MQGVAFCPVTFLPSCELLICCSTWEGFVNWKSFLWCQLSQLSEVRHYLWHCFTGKELAFCTLTGRFFHIFCTTYCFASSEDSMHSLNSDHALTLHQIWEQQWVVAQHSLFSWPGDTSKGFQHRRDTSWGLGKLRQSFPALAPQQRL